MKEYYEITAEELREMYKLNEMIKAVLNNSELIAPSKIAILAGLIDMICEEEGESTEETFKTLYKSAKLHDN